VKGAISPLSGWTTDEVVVPLVSLENTFSSRFLRDRDGDAGGVVSARSLSK